MATTLTSISSFSQTFSAPTNHPPRDVSFSSYSNIEEETFIRKLAESSPYLNSKTTIQEKDHNHHINLHLGKEKEEDREIGVFSAEKYFNGGMDEDSPRAANLVSVRRKYHYLNRPEKSSEELVVPGKAKLQPGTPSIRSESSWNSQSALLQNFLKTPSRRRPNKVQGKGFFAGLGCKCSDRDSVDVHEVATKDSFNRIPVNSGAATKESLKITVDFNKPSFVGSWVQEEKKKIQFNKESDKLGIGLDKENCFTFPDINPPSGNIPIKFQVLEDQEELQPRKSLEVFDSSIPERRNKTIRIENRLTMFSWGDALAPRMEDEMGISASSGRVYNNDNDNDSDASSDLFEIESLRVTGKVTPSLGRQGSNGTSGCLTPTTCYAPSEASIEWSVITASAADVSVVSDYNQALRPGTGTSARGPMRHVTSRDVKELPWAPQCSGILLGCYSQKAVKVAGDAHRVNDRANYEHPLARSMSGSYLPAVTRIQAESKLTGYGKLRAPASATTRFRSPDESHLLFV